MALTDAELKAKDAARLESLIAQLMAARRTGNPDDLQGALGAIGIFRTTFADLRRRAERARMDATEAISSTALAKLADIADGLSSAGAGFKAAAMIAENGQKDLLFPTLAGTAARGLELATQLKAAVEAVKANVANVSELGDVPAAVNGLLAAFNSLKESLEAVEGD